MLRRLLNIASIVCLVACVALTGMWVRSYYGSDAVWLRLEKTIGCGVTSQYGRLLWIYDDRGMPVNHTAVGTMPLTHALESSTRDRHDFVGFKFWYGQVKLVFPYWFAVLCSGGLAMICRSRWPWRFTLRSMFATTTLVTMVLGLMAWLDRAWIAK